jgi:hypothetical protein
MGERGSRLRLPRSICLTGKGVWGCSARSSTRAPRSAGPPVRLAPQRPAHDRQHEHEGHREPLDARHPGCARPDGVCPSRARSRLYRPVNPITNATARPRRARRLSIQARPVRAEAVAIETALEQPRSVQPGRAGLLGCPHAARSIKAGLSSPAGMSSEWEGWMAALCSGFTRSEQRSVVKDLIAVSQHSLPRGTFHDVVPLGG